MISLKELAKKTTPERTVLFFGSGVSKLSGGPTGTELAKYLWKRCTGEEYDSEDLVEACSLIETNYGRRKLIDELRTKLRDLQPSGSLLALPKLTWHSIYTTNFDCLIEATYRRAGKPIITVRSNYEYGAIERSEGIPLFKIHGCMTQDEVDGHKGRMILSEQDYEDFAKYREALFGRLSLDLKTKNVLIIGHSLKDPHLKRDIRDAAKLHKGAGAGGEVVLMLYEKDEIRARHIEKQYGIQVCFGTLDDLLNQILESPQFQNPSITTPAFDILLSAKQLLNTIDVSSGRPQESNVDALFRGRAATYSDIADNLTFPRVVESKIIDELENQNKTILIITGVAGVGKTTLARRIVKNLHEKGYHAWEHRPEFPFMSSYWESTAQQLKTSNQKGVLLVDECLNSLRQIGKLANKISESNNPHLKIVLTANHSLWVPRIKEPAIFQLGTAYKLSELSDFEINELVNLASAQPKINHLVDEKFKRLSRQEKVAALRNRCKSDMYVCLKNIFGFESLDAILLKEYADLSELQQEVYRYVAALDATGALVHRQLILRILNMSATSMSGVLEQMDGLVNEYDIKVSEGLYRWSTRHEVIARTISKFKFVDDEELYEYFKRIIANINPSIWIELRMINDLCDGDYGIGRINNPTLRCELYRKLIATAPSERVPKHRLISTLLQLNDIDGAETEIRIAEKDITMDPVIHRYKVRMKSRRALVTQGITDKDRMVLLRDAEREAIHGIDLFEKNKMAYIAYAEVGQMMAEMFNDPSSLDAAVAAMKLASSVIMDPEFDNKIHALERNRIAELSRK